MLCDRLFKSVEYGRQQHFVTAHTVEMISCRICGRVYPNVFSFRTHVNKTHKVVGVKDVVNVYGVRRGGGAGGDDGGGAEESYDS